MPQQALTLADQLAICQQVSRLVRSKLPIAGELSQWASGATDQPIAAAATIDQQMLAGKSLAESIASDPSRDSRMLSACISIGQPIGKLAQTLEAWTEMHLACSRYSKSLRAALVYPTLLIVVTLASLGYVIWHLIPEYRATFAQFHVDLPMWLQWLIWLREQLGFLLFGLLCLALAPLAWWYWRRRRYDAHELPRDVPRRLRIQVLSAELLKCGIDGGLPLTELVPWSVQASGGSSDAVDHAFDLVRDQKRVPQLAHESSLLVASLHAGLLTAQEVADHLAQVADALRQQADDRAARAAHWLPMMVALTVGGLTILTYVFLIYVPWVLLLLRIVEAR